MGGPASTVTTCDSSTNTPAINTTLQVDYGDAAPSRESVPTIVGEQETKASEVEAEGEEETPVASTEEENTKAEQVKQEDAKQEESTAAAAADGEPTTANKRQSSWSDSEETFRKMYSMMKGGGKDEYLWS